MEDERELATLTLLLRRGDAAAWDQVYRLTHLPILRLLRRWLRDEATAEEALQAAYVVAVERIADFDPERGGIDAWLTGIARRHAQNISRRNGRDGPLDVEPIDPTADSATIDAEMVELALDQLDPRYAEVLRRKYFVGETLQTIARCLGLKSATVGTLLHRGRDQFRAAYSRLLARSEAS